MTRAQSLKIYYTENKNKENFVPLVMYIDSLYKKYQYIEFMCGLEPLSKGNWLSQRV